MRFDQCTETCTTDCGHCKGRPVKALRADNERLGRRCAARFEEAEKLRAEVATLTAERDRLRAEPHQIERELAAALDMDDWEHPQDLIGIARALRLGDEEAAAALAERDALAARLAQAERVVEAARVEGFNEAIALLQEAGLRFGIAGTAGAPGRRIA